MPHQASSDTSSSRYPHAYANGSGYYNQGSTQATMQRNMPSRARVQYAAHPGSTMQRAMPEDTRMYGAHHGADRADNYRAREAHDLRRDMEYGPRTHHQPHNIPTRPNRFDPRSVHIPRTSSRGSETDSYPYVTQSLDSNTRTQHGMRMMQRDMPHILPAPQQQQQPPPVTYSASMGEMARPHSMTEYSTYDETRRMYVGRVAPGQQSSTTNNFSSIDQLRSQPTEGYSDTAAAFSRSIQHSAPVHVESPRAHIRHMPYAQHSPPKEAGRRSSSVWSSPESAKSAFSG